MAAGAPPRHARDDGGGWRPIGEIADDVVRRIGFRAIRFHLNPAAASGGCEALASVREASGICRQLGLSWDQVVADAGASDFSPKGNA